jgi:drug/metabolite transporter (DMT)-like permease
MNTTATKTKAATSRESLPWSGLLHLFVVYVVWGSTYLAIRIAVREGSGFPPFTMAAMRLILGGLILLIWAGMTGTHLRTDRREMTTLLVSGLALWIGGNGLVVWAEQRVDSSLTALIIGATPIWVAMIEAMIDRKAPSVLLMVSLLVGLGGIGVLSAPVLLKGVRGDTWSILALLGATLSWGCGTLLQSRRPIQASPLVSSGYQQMFGGLGLAALALLAGEPRPTPIFEAWAAWGYLVVFGSILAFTSFVQAVKMLPINIVMTYSYVNPVIAMFLGWIILDEPITLWTIGGAVLVLLGVAGVFRVRYADRNQARRGEDPANGINGKTSDTQ